MINKVNMDGVKGYGEGTAQVPKGGYICKIMGAIAKENRVGQYMEISCDIAEGEYKDIFANDYRGQTGETKKWHCNSFVNIPLDDGSERDEWSKRGLQTFIDALELSNPGYHWDWDETKLKGKSIGGIFGLREWEDKDGNVHEGTSLMRWTSIEKIRSGHFRVPADKRLEAHKAQSSGGFTSVSDADLPF